MTLSTESNFPDPDTAYRMIVGSHRGLSDQESRQLNSALVLVLANHIGDLGILREAVALSKAGLGLNDRIG